MKPNPRAIRIDKNRIRSLAQELTEVLKRFVARRTAPLDDRVISSGFVYWSLNVRKQEVPSRIVLAARPSSSHEMFTGGAKGTHTPTGEPVVVVWVNGSIPADKIHDSCSRFPGVVEKYIYRILIHELTHVADIVPESAGREEQEVYEDLAAYYNSPHEVRAYLQEVLDEVASHIHQFEKLRRVLGTTLAVSSTLGLSRAWADIEPYLNETNKRRFYRAVAQLAREHTP